MGRIHRPTRILWHECPRPRPNLLHHCPAAAAAADEMKLCISMLWLKSPPRPAPHILPRYTRKKNPNKQYLCYSLVKRSMHLTRAHHATVYDVNCNAPIWPAHGPCLIAFNLGYITACGQTIFRLTACGQTITASGQLICTGSGQVTASGCRLLGVRHLDAV